MEFLINGVKVVIDAEKTADFYEKLNYSADGCDCAGCRNFAEAADLLPEKVTDFFSSAGADVRKATETIPWFSENGGKTVFYGGFYHLCGSVDITDGITEPLELTKGYSVRFQPEISLPEDSLPENAIQMEIEFHGVPWVIDEENPY